MALGSEPSYNILISMHSYSYKHACMPKNQIKIRPLSASTKYLGEHLVKYTGERLVKYLAEYTGEYTSCRIHYNGHFSRFPYWNAMKLCGHVGNMYHNMPKKFQIKIPPLGVIFHCYGILPFY